MALRKESEDLVKITANIFAEDWVWAQATFEKVGASKALRQAFRKFRRETEAKMKKAKGKLDVEVELG